MLIGLTGLKRSGKDTAADHLQHMLGFERTMFAAPLKAMLLQLYNAAGVSPDMALRKIAGDLKEEPCPVLCGQTPRWAMQTLGTEWRDLIDRTLWTHIWLNRIGSLLMDGKDVVVTDCRFHHEASAIRQLGGKIVQVYRPSLPYRTEDLHLSEQEMLNIIPDATVTNDGSIADLHKKIEGVYLDFSQDHR